MTRLRYLTAGESHGPCLTTIVEGCPAGLPLLAEHLDTHLVRRQRGYGRGGRMKIERDRARILSGVRGGETLGSPITLQIENRDFERWTGRMGAEPFDAPPAPMVRPRPGHADLAGVTKYDRADVRDVLERASARETAARVAAGSVARRLLDALGVAVAAHVTAIGGVEARPAGDDVAAWASRALASELACADAAAEAAMREEIQAASRAGDTVGGVVECVAMGLPVGLGSHVHWDRRLDGRLAGALMSVQAVKGVELGLGFRAASMRGSEVHDPIVRGPVGLTRSQNGAGGVEGGMTNGMPLVVRVAMKPISTLRRALPSVNLATGEPEEAAFERSDVCAVGALPVIVESVVALVLADALLEKTGGDSLGEVRRNLAAYVDRAAR